MAEEYTTVIDGPSDMELDLLMSSLMSPVDSGVDSIDDISVSSRNFETVCPLCQNELQYYQISMTTKFKMCSDLSCEYPFNLTDTQVKPLECTSPAVSKRGSYRHNKVYTDSGVAESQDYEVREECLDVNAYLDAEDSDDEMTAPSSASNKEQEKINKLLQDSSKLVFMLNKTKGLFKKGEILRDTTYLRKLVAIQNSSKSKQALVSDEELRIMKESERKIEMNDQIEVNIQLPTDAHSLCRIDILKA